VILSHEDRRRIIEILTHKPFDCNEVCFFFLTDKNEVAPLDDENSASFYVGHKNTVDTLLKEEEVPGWRGNVLREPRDEDRIDYYACYRFGPVAVVVSKEVEVAPDTHAAAPFDKYFVDALFASVSPIIGKQVSLPHTGCPDTTDEYVFVEFDSLEQCKALWRRKHPGKWLAIKDGQPVKDKGIVVEGNSYDDLETKIKGLVIEPPILFMPPAEEGSEFNGLESRLISKDKRRRGR
jgi:hypothetical protein